MAAPSNKPHRAGRREAGQTCLICHVPIIIGEWLTSCSSCKLHYHLECWNENGGCAQYGCDQAPDAEQYETNQFQSNVWAEDKTCPTAINASRPWH